MALWAERHLRITAASQFNPAAGDSYAPDRPLPRRGLSVGLTKSVDRATAVPGDPVTYTLSYTALGTGSSTSLRDPGHGADRNQLPARHTQARRDPLTDGSGDDEGTISPTGNGVVTVDLGPVATGAPAP